MKISWMKSIEDKESFLIPQKMGFNVIELDNLECIDKEINELINKKCNTIVLSSEVAGFSEDIIKKYSNNSNVNIIIAPSKRK